MRLREAVFKTQYCEWSKKYKRYKNEKERKEGKRERLEQCQKDVCDYVILEIVIKMVTTALHKQRF